jgi:hypothetical protein
MEIALASVAVAVVGLSLAWSARAAWRMRVHWSVVRGRGSVIEGQDPRPNERHDLTELKQRFDQEWIITAEDFLEPTTLQQLQTEVMENQPRLVRSFVPTHKQGGTVSYETLHSHAPGCLALYHSPRMHQFVEAVTGVAVRPAGDHDQSACSILYYTQAGDYINWHYDPNFYHGRQFTILIVLVNESRDGQGSTSKLMRKHRDGRVEAVELPVNTLVMFEGARVLHKVSPATEGDRRIVLSMTLNTDPTISLHRELARRVKDTAFYGFKVLWD